MSEPLISSPPATAHAAPPAVAPMGAPVAASSGRLTIAEPGHPLRGAFEAFVEARFAACFDARLRRHYPRLAGLVGADGTPRAVAGVRFADEEPLFLERYLDTPVEAALPPFHHAARRGQIVEIGSLASEGPCAAISLFQRLAAWLRCEQERQIAVATLTPTLERLLRGGGFELLRLAQADPARLGAGRDDWGGYYDASPAVFAGEIPLGRPRFGTAAGPRRRWKRLDA